MNKIVTVFTVSEYFDGEMAEPLAFSSYEKAFKDIENEYLNAMQEAKDSGASMVDSYILEDCALVETEYSKHVWRLDKVVVDGFMTEKVQKQ